MGALSSVLDLISRQGRYGAAMQQGVETALPQGPQMRARTWRTHPLDFLSTRAADTLVGRDSPAFQQTEGGISTLISLLRSGLEPSGPASPATVAGGIPPASVEGVWTKVYEKLSGMKGKDPFRVGGRASVQMGDNTISGLIDMDTDADIARDAALDYLSTRIKSQDIPDEVIAGGDDAIVKRIYNESLREGILRLNREKSTARGAGFTNLTETANEEGQVIDKLAEVADPRLGKTAQEIEQAFAPGQAAATEAAREERLAGAEDKLSQVLRNIMNPSVRKMLLAKQEGIPTRDLAKARFSPEEGSPIPSWMLREVRRDKNEALKLARAGDPGMEIRTGLPGSGKQFQVVRDDLRNKKSAVLDPAIGALPEGLREAVREYMTRRVKPSDLARKYSKKGVTQQSLFDALVRLSQDVPGE